MTTSQAPEQFSGQEFAVGPLEYRSVIFAASAADLDLMHVAAGTEGVTVAPIENEDEVVEACRTQARELRLWAESQPDEDGGDSDGEHAALAMYDETLTERDVRLRLSAGQVAVRLVVKPYSRRYPTTGDFYQKLYELRDAHAGIE